MSTDDVLWAVRKILKERDAIRLKHIKEMLDQCDKRPDEVVAPAVAVLMAEKKAIEEFLGEPA